MLSTGEWTRLKRLQGSKEQNQYKIVTPVGLPSDNTTAKAMVLACIDPRYTYATEQFLINQLDATNKYDLFALAGSPLGPSFLGDTGPLYIPADYQEIFFEHLQIARALHSITDVWVFDHLDCGAYKNFYSPPLSGPNSPDCTISNHTTVIAGMKTALANSGIAGITGLNVKAYLQESPECGGGSCFSGVTGTTLTNTGFCPGIPPNTGASVFVLGCIDPRYSALLSKFLIDFKNIKFNYDLFNLAGASLGVNQSYGITGAVRTAVATAPYLSNQISGFGVKWGPVFFQHIDIALAIHNITEVWVFDHLDCGAYKAIKFGCPVGSFGPCPDLDISPHTEELLKLQTNIKTRYPSLNFKGFVMDTQGNLNKVIDSGGLNLDKQFGSSRIRNPASLLTDRLAFSKADYLTKSSTSACQPKLQINKLCSCDSSTTFGQGLCYSCNSHLR